MTEDRDFKHLVRARMRKTGESYTTARAHLLAKTETSTEATEAADHAAIAGIGDEAVHQKTGRSWEEWVEVLDLADASTWPHRDIAAYVAKNYGVSGWWAQMITVGYERIKGLRDVGQRRDGSYEVNKSKTFAVPVERLYRAFRDVRLRRRWLPEVDLVVRQATPSKSMRITWTDGTPVEFYFASKGSEKSSATVQHRKLGSASERRKMRGYWSKRLEELDALLRG